MDSQSEPSMASLGFEVSRARMVVFGFVSEFSECSKIPGRADPRPLCCPRSTDSAARACPCASHSLSLCLSSGSHSFILSLSFISIFFSNIQSSIFPSMSSFWPPGPDPAPFLAYFERGVAVPAISALAVKTSVCRDSQPRSE